MKICKDGRVWGQNNREAGKHLGISIPHIAKGGVKGNKNPMYGTSRCGELSPNWRGGISSMKNRIHGQVQYRLWREAVFARDNWTCQECGKQGGRLNAHHIKSFAEYPELRFAIDNGKTLCIECHKLTNDYCGRKAK